MLEIILLMISMIIFGYFFVSFIDDNKQLEGYKILQMLAYIYIIYFTINLLHKQIVSEKQIIKLKKELIKNK